MEKLTVKTHEEYRSYKNTKEDDSLTVEFQSQQNGDYNEGSFFLTLTNFKNDTRHADNRRKELMKLIYENVDKLNEGETMKIHFSTKVVHEENGDWTRHEKQPTVEFKTERWF